ncbi:hypothetical protein B046DRAFT_05580 [Streptomyces sp. LamerLS-316]|uniref:hypothetical protein n=1 Tax=unclassified Streptomyces TaxID=2593676 RepID=UPI000823ED9C|nr:MULTISPECIES: hypothetical protein [unclassified Streptomyces]MYQ36921.1 hypothetical protein [Streptomyces sp. SID4921]SCK51852.1 hypothetical protein B046DRAFT_05580 [Streptomyces sp. LamerLS-316]
MDRTDVIISLVAVLALVVAGKLLKNTSFWLIIVVAAVSYPVDRKLLSVLESAAGAASTWAAHVFMVSTALVFTALVSQAVRGFRSFRGARGGRPDHHREIDA